MYDTVIWDFNGTLLDDLQTGIDAVNKMLASRSLPIILNVDDYYEKFGFPIRDYYKRLGFDFSREPYETLAIEWVDNYLELSKNARLREGISELLQKLKEKRIRQIVLSATEQRMLEKQLADLKIIDCFECICGGKDINAHGKLDEARALSEKICGNTVMVGDTLHDRDAAYEMGTDCILLCGGHNSDCVLDGSGATVCKSVAELETVLFR